jgi:hypothetical protein
MKILANPLLSRNFSFYNLKLNHKGLFYVNRNKDNSVIQEIFITIDLSKILSIMDLKFEDINNINDAAFFQILLDCEYFKTKKFNVDVSDGKCFLLNSFSNYLKTVEYKNLYTRITFERIMEFYSDENDFKNKYEKSCYVIANRKKIQKLQGIAILNQVVGYDRTQLSTTIPYFHDHAFSDEIEKQYFFITSNQEEIINKFLEVTKSVYNESAQNN